MCDRCGKKNCDKHSHCHDKDNKVEPKQPVLDFSQKEFNKPGNVLITDQFNNRVIETNPRGDIVWSFGLGPNDFSSRSVLGVNDAERVGTNTLMAGTGIPPNTVANKLGGAIDSRVILVDKHGKIIWQYGQFGVTGSGSNLLNSPVQNTYIPHKKCSDKCSDKCKCRRHGHGVLNGGTVLITDQGNNRVIEVDEAKNILRTYTIGGTMNSPNSAQKLKNGNILIADEGNNRAVEVTQFDKVVQIYTANNTLGACAFASRLPNGNTLLTDAGNNRIVEVNEANQIVWQYITNSDPNSIVAPSPSRGLRLRNGNTIIADQYNNRVITVDPNNVVVASYGLPLGIPTPGQDLPYPYGFNFGYSLQTTQLGIFSPYSAEIIGDYTGLTKP